MSGAGSTPWAIVDFSLPDGTPHREVFYEPVSVVVAQSTADVVPALEQVEAHAAAGRYAVGFVAYDAAPAFDTAFRVRSGYRGPLVWFAIFNAPAPEHDVVGADEPQAEWHPSIDRETYQAATSEIIEGIKRGDYYQVNYTARLGGIRIADPVASYERLRRAQGGRYAAYIDTGAGSVLSVSPELFFRRTGDAIETRPMKGTAARGRWPAEDRGVARLLRASEKERAENVMIVDLLRNDLGRVAIPGTVEVPALFDVERYSTVWQMTSTVSAQVPSRTSLVDVFAALFPCGSVTGAPKIAAAAAIAKLEADARGIYCGAIGIVKPGGDCVFNVAIRTLTVGIDGSATYGAGGGITADSDPEQEYAELLAKTAVLSARPVDFDLFETMRLEGGVIQRLDRHLSRLSGSAEYFDFEAVDAGVAGLREALLFEASQRPTGVFRARAVLAPGGKHSVEISQFEEASTLPRRMRIAATPVASADRMLFHKTTRRDLYANRLREVPGVDDVILFNERGQLTECTIGNLVLELDGKSITPSIESGLLPGILREELLQVGTIAEQVVPVGALDRCTRLWMINSLRGWVPVAVEKWIGG